MMRLLAPAKINLHLRVAPPSADGFHPLVSWMCTIGLFDTLTIEPRRGDVSAASRPLTLSCDDPAVPCDDSNLVARAANALISSEGLCLHAVHPTGLPSVHVHLSKRIPSGAGLGGGSSDAAAALRGLARFWKLDVAPSALSEVTARVGSDVSFFLTATGSSACTGRGQIVQDLPRPAQGIWALLVLPDIHMPTPRVYRRFDEMCLGKPENLEPAPPWHEWVKLQSMELLSRLVNDLEPAAFDVEPRLAELWQATERAVGRTVRMSGSGSSLFTLFDTQAEAVRASGDARSLGARMEVVPLAPVVREDESRG